MSSVGLSLRASFAASGGQPTLHTAVGVKSKFQMIGVSTDHCLRLAPGDVDHSVVLVRMRSRDINNYTDDELKAMFAYLRTIPAIKNAVPEPIPPAPRPADPVPAKP